MPHDVYRHNPSKGGAKVGALTAAQVAFPNTRSPRDEMPPLMGLMEETARFYKPAAQAMGDVVRDYWNKNSGIQILEDVTRTVVPGANAGMSMYEGMPAGQAMDQEAQDWLPFYSAGKSLVNNERPDMGQMAIDAALTVPAMGAFKKGRGALSKIGAAALPAMGMASAANAQFMPDEDRDLARIGAGQLSRGSWNGG